MTLYKDEHTIIDHNETPYTLLASITGLDANTIRTVDHALMEYDTASDVTDLIETVLEISEYSFTVIHDRAENQSHVVEVVE